MTMWIRSQWQWHIVDPDDDDPDGDPWPLTLCCDFEPPDDGVQHTRTDDPPVDEQCIECVRERDWRNQ